jgi:putative SOS response-associated peptidase YedK
MCGRYRLSRRKQIIEVHFDSFSGEEDWNPRYNIAPAQPVPIIRQHPREPRRELSLVRWGLIPSWAKDTTGSAQMINSRSESAATRSRPEKRSHLHVVCRNSLSVCSGPRLLAFRYQR